MDFVLNSETIEKAINRGLDKAEKYGYKLTQHD